VCVFSANKKEVRVSDGLPFMKLPTETGLQCPSTPNRQLDEIQTNPDVRIRHKTADREASDGGGDGGHENSFL